MNPQLQLKFYPAMKVVNTVEEGEKYLLEKWGYEELWQQILWLNAAGLVSRN